MACGGEVTVVAYTGNLEEAGEYTFDEACAIVGNANQYMEYNLKSRTVTPNEAMISVVR